MHTNAGGRLAGALSCVLSVPDLHSRLSKLDFVVGAVGILFHRGRNLEKVLERAKKKKLKELEHGKKYQLGSHEPN